MKPAYGPGRRKYSWIFAAIGASCLLRCDPDSRGAAPLVTPISTMFEGIGDASVAPSIPLPSPVNVLVVPTPAPRRWTMANGLRVEHFVRNDVPLTHLRLLVPSAGILAEPSNNPGIARWFAYLLATEGTRRHPRELFLQQMAAVGSMPTIETHSQGLLLSWTLASEHLEVALRSISAMLSEPPLSPSAPFASGPSALPVVDSSHVLQHNTASQAGDALALLPRVAPQYVDDFRASATLVRFPGAGQMRSYVRSNIAATSMSLVIVAPEDPALQPMVQSLLAPIPRGRFSAPSRTALSGATVMLAAERDTIRIAFRFAGLSPIERQTLALIPRLLRRCAIESASPTTPLEVVVIPDALNPILMMHVSGPADRALETLTFYLAQLTHERCLMPRYEPLRFSSQAFIQAESRVAELLVGDETPVPLQTPITVDLVRALIQRILRDVPTQLSHR